MTRPASLNVLGYLLFAMAAGFLGVAVLGFDPFVTLLERYVSPDGHLKDSTKVMLELRLYAYAAASAVGGGFVLACTRDAFRAAVRGFVLYDPSSPRAPAPARVLTALTLIVTALVLVSLLGQYLRYVADLGDTRFALFVYTYFNLDREHWVPTTFSAALLLYGAVLLAIVARRKRAAGGDYVVHWALLALAFAYLSIDEKFRVHEWAFNFMRPYIDVDVPVFWVVPAGVLTLIGVLAYTRFLFHLPPLFRALFVLAGALYVGGAIGWEIVGRAYALEHGVDNFVYEQLANAEETFEMLGALTFIYALQSYLVGRAAAPQAVPATA